jgi:hypothetical protein
MSKITFWIMVVVAATVGIYLEKTIAAKSNIPGLQAFMEVI